jgi:hypothetical protein
MTTASLKIERQNYTIENMEFSDYLVDMTAENDYFVEIKQNLQEVFTEFFMSESFKTNDNVEGFRMLHYSFNQLLDDLFLAHNRGKMNYLQEQLDKVKAMDKVEPKKEILN